MTTSANPIISWFSCGAASAVATKLAIATSPQPIRIAYCEVKEEHADNKRFLKECEQWFGQHIMILGNDKYNRSAYEVFYRTRYLYGIRGARCSLKLKKELRQKFERPGDVHVLGFTSEEQHRVDRFVDSNNDTYIWPILIEHNLTKQDCLAMIKGAGIELPTMYKMGYKNNNCIGCVKGGKGYWNKIRVDFPEVFEKMVKVEEVLGFTRFREGRKGKFISLAELPPNAGVYEAEPSISCGAYCEAAQETFTTRDN